MAALLANDEPPPFTIDRPSGRSPFLIACDHAGRLLPRALGTLGVIEVGLNALDIPHGKGGVGAAVE